MGAKSEVSRPSISIGVDVNLSYEGEGSHTSCWVIELDIMKVKSLALRKLVRGNPFPRLLSCAIYIFELNQ